MLQIARGGKYVYGWSIVGPEGQIVVPPEAVAEYGLAGHERGILLPGSKASRGFSLTTAEWVRRSPLDLVLGKDRRLGEFAASPGEIVEIDGKRYCWVWLQTADAEDDGQRVTFTVPPETLARYRARPGWRLLVVRGSSLAIGFVSQGRLIEEAKRYDGRGLGEIPVFT